jgi:phosphatidylglycerophosphate synthase
MPKKLQREEVYEIYDKIKGIQYTKRIYTYFGIKVADFLIKTKITPNQITILSAIFGIIAAIFLIRDVYIQMIIGALLIQLSLILDRADGSLARRKALKSKLGLWYDLTLDRLVDAVIIVSIYIGIYFSTGNRLFLFWGLAAVALRFLIDNLSISFETTMGSSEALNKDLNNKFLSQLIYTRDNIFLGLLIFAVFNLLQIYAVLLLIYSLLFYICSFIILTKKIK